ncbi:hypothetical protein NDU88_002945 [Pleurodeles waltl]|uniref:Uncharacterized protein n=1 Tax=Pleurodeles waltl TaxID=8319 RepID=A0AAV7TM52_PLEWA|nr:hypothetical protein NDU88_002945 [Pleurodeles waltl]
MDSGTISKGARTMRDQPLIVFVRLVGKLPHLCDVRRLARSVFQPFEVLTVGPERSRPRRKCYTSSP